MPALDFEGLDPRARLARPNPQKKTFTALGVETETGRAPCAQTNTHPPRDDTYTDRQVPPWQSTHAATYRKCVHITAASSRSCSCSTCPPHRWRPLRSAAAGRVPSLTCPHPAAGPNTSNTTTGAFDLHRTRNTNTHNTNTATADRRRRGASRGTRNTDTATAGRRRRGTSRRSFGAEKQKDETKPENHTAHASPQ